MFSREFDKYLLTYVYVYTYIERERRNSQEEGIGNASFSKR